LSKRDPLLKLKYIGYCRTFFPPKGNSSLHELLRVAKQFLCNQTRTLWNDPIWDRYSDEEILVEYYAYQFSINEEFLGDFESQIGKENFVSDDLLDWFDEQIEENKKELEAKAAKLDDDFSVSPNELIGDTPSYPH